MPEQAKKAATAALPNSFFQPPSIACEPPLCLWKHSSSLHGIAMCTLWTLPHCAKLCAVQGRAGARQLYQPLHHVSLLPHRRRIGRPGCGWPRQDGGAGLRPDQECRAGLSEPVQQPRQLLRLQKLPLGLLRQLSAPCWPHLQSRDDTNLGKSANLITTHMHTLLTEAPL